MASELRKKALEAEDIRTEEVHVPEWDVTLKVKGMTGAQRAKFLRSASNPVSGEVNFEKFFANLVIATAFDPDSDEPVFEDADRDALNQKSGAVINRLALVAQDLSGLGDKVMEDAKGN